MTTTTGIEDGQIIKTDELGRVLVSRERREALLEEYERSKMSSAAFAQWAGIKSSTFAGWVQKRRRERKPLASVTTVPTQSIKPSVGWVEAIVDQAPKMGSGLMMYFFDGVRMEIRDERGAALAAEVLKHLKGAAGC